MTPAVPVPPLPPAVAPLPPVFRARLRARAKGASCLQSAHPIDARVSSV